MRKNSTEEIEKLIDDIKWLNKTMPTAVKNWNNTRPNCDLFSGILKNLCENPNILNRVIFDPLIKWLFDYILVLDKKIDIGKKFGSLDEFLKIGLRVMAKFIVTAEFFSKHTDLFLPDPPGPMGSEYVSKMVEINKQRDQYRRFINLLSSKLIGCQETTALMFLSLTKTIKNLDNDLKSLINYLDNRCTDIRLEKLKGY